MNKPKENTNKKNSPWIEKYRPEFLKDVVGNSEAVSRLEAISKVGNVSQCIWYLL